MIQIASFTARWVRAEHDDDHILIMTDDGRAADVVTWEPSSNPNRNLASVREALDAAGWYARSGAAWEGGTLRVARFRDQPDGRHNLTW